MSAEPVDPEQALSKLRIAVVDDNAAMRGIVRTVLASLGCDNVYEASDAESALSVLRAQPIDIIILDWKMKPVDGLDLVKTIRNPELSPNPFLPIIMLTAYGEPSKVRQARDAGVTEFMIKPFSAEALYRRLAVIINRPRPFVRTKAFFGPDRRRLEVSYEGPERREDAPIS
ncbi:MAG: response regulator [Oceanicaulis sp.]